MQSLKLHSGTMSAPQERGWLIPMHSEQWKLQRQHRSVLSEEEKNAEGFPWFPACILITFHLDAFLLLSAGLYGAVDIAVYKWEVSRRPLRSPSMGLAL